MKKTKTDWIAMTQQEMNQPMKGFRLCMGRTNQRLDKSFIRKEGCYTNLEDISGKIWAPAVKSSKRTFLKDLKDLRPGGSIKRSFFLLDSDL
jgi:hypothetical protein